MQTANMGGMLLGSLLCGAVSDKVGRKPTLLLSLAPLMVGGCLPLSFPSTPDYYWLLVLARAVSGFGAVGAFIMSLCLALEYVGAQHRVLLGISIQVTISITIRYFSTSDIQGSFYSWWPSGWICISR